MSTSLDRRTFLGVTGAAPVAATLAHGAAAETRKRIAMITTVWTYQSHAQHMGDRFLVGYPLEGRWHRPEFDIVSLYVDQHPDKDQSKGRAEQFGFTRFPTIAAALRAGGESLAVDGVLIIGEHGEYEDNAKGQKLYPRFEFFQQVADVFRQDRRSVPVFNDKHLSYSFTKATKMVAASKELGFPLMAGSSLPVTWRFPSVEIPKGSKVGEALMVGVGGSDAMDFHALEAMQCMLERRQGGETGIRAVQLVDGDEVWTAGDRGRWSWELLEAALSRSNQLQGRSRSEAKPQDIIRNGQLRELAQHPAAYLIEYEDGLRATLLMLSGAVGDFTFAARLAEPRSVVSTLFYLPPTPNVEYSAQLMNRVEQMFATRQATTPVERTLLVSGLLESCLDSRAAGNRRLPTPHLNVRYQPPADSQFART
jgi:hypothetical protein